MHKPTLLITEWYLPVVGGSVNFFIETYRRFPEGMAHVLTGFPLAEGEVDSSPLPVTRVDLRRRIWMRPESLAMYLRLVHHGSRLLSRDGWKEVHCGHVLPEALVAWILKLRHGTPYIIFCHGEEVSIQRRDPVKRRLMPWLYNRSAGIIANSHNSRRLLEDLGVRPDLIEVIHPGVDLKRFQPAALPERQGLELLSVGRLQPRKGHSQVLRALVHLRKEFPDLRYRIAGEGETQAKLESLVRELDLGKMVEFLGSVTDSALPTLYQSCDLFVLANRHLADDDLEGFGMVFLEAAACSKAVVGGRSGGVVDAVLDGETGLLVDSEDIEALAEALRRLLRDKELRDRMGRTGRVRAEAEFNWQGVSDRIAALGASHGA